MKDLKLNKCIDLIAAELMQIGSLTMTTATPRTTLCKFPSIFRFFQKKGRYVFDYLMWYQIGRTYEDNDVFNHIFKEDYIAKFYLEILSDVFLGGQLMR